MNNTLNTPSSCGLKSNDTPLPVATVAPAAFKTDHARVKFAPLAGFGSVTVPVNVTMVFSVVCRSMPALATWRLAKLTPSTTWPPGRKLICCRPASCPLPTTVVPVAGRHPPGGCSTTLTGAVVNPFNVTCTLSMAHDSLTTGSMPTPLANQRMVTVLPVCGMFRKRGSSAMK